MFTDIVLPHNNEAEFIEIASKLGIKKLYFLYDFNYYNEDKIGKKLALIKNSHNINIEAGIIANQKNLNKAQHQSRLIAAKSSDSDRFFIESKKMKLIYGFEETSKRDYLHQRASGLNHITCEIAKKNNVSVGFSYSSLLNKSGFATSLLIGRMIQNIALCQKYKVKTIIGSFSQNPFHLRSQHDLECLFALLGMSIKNIRNSL